MLFVGPGNLIVKKCSLAIKLLLSNAIMHDKESNKRLKLSLYAILIKHTMPAYIPTASATHLSYFNRYMIHWRIKSFKY